MPRKRQAMIVRKIEAKIFPFNIFLFTFDFIFESITPRKSPELNLYASGPLIFARISKNPGRIISMLGMRRIFLV